MLIKNLNRYAYEISGLSLRNVSAQKYLVFDLEATGLDTKRDHVTQVGCVPIVSGKILVREAFSSYVKSPKPIPKVIERLTGISNEKISKAPSLKTVLQPLLKKYKDNVWVAQCGFEFDFPLLERLCKKYKIKFAPQKIDTKVLFAHLHKDLEDTFSTDLLKSYYGIDASDLKRHDALSDSILIARILQKMLAEYETRRINDITLRKPLKIKKFVPR